MSKLSFYWSSHTQDRSLAELSSCTRNSVALEAENTYCVTHCQLLVYHMARPQLPGPLPSGFCRSSLPGPLGPRPSPDRSHHKDPPCPASEPAFRPSCLPLQRPHSNSPNSSPSGPTRSQRSPRRGRGRLWAGRDCGLGALLNPPASNAQTSGLRFWEPSWAWNPEANAAG